MSLPRGGRRVDPGERRAVGSDKRVGTVATDAEHRRALDDVDAHRCGELRGDNRALHPGQREHPALDRRAVDGEDALLRHLGGGDHGAGRDQVSADHGHLAHLERRQRQDQRRARSSAPRARRPRWPALPGDASGAPTGGDGACAAPRVAALARRRLELRPGIGRKAPHRPGGVDDQRRLGADQGDVARSLVEHVSAHEACSVLEGQCINAG